MQSNNAITDVHVMSRHTQYAYIIYVCIIWNADTGRT